MRDGIVAVIVTRNRLKKLKKALRSVLTQNVTGAVVVDNQSSDGTAQWLNRQDSSRLIIVTPQNNLGGAGGFAVGMQKAVEVFDPEWLLCFDDDAYPADDLIVRFRSMNIAPDVGIISSAVFLPDREISEMNRPLFQAPISVVSILLYLSGWRADFVVADDYYSAGIFLEIQASSFVGCFVGRKVVAAIGYPRQELFIYADDIIYTYQAFASGFKNIFNPDLIFYHDCLSIASKRIEPLWKVYFLLRNQIEMHKTFNKKNFLLPAVLRFSYFLMRFFHYGRQRKEYLKLICRAFHDGIMGNFPSKPWLGID